MILHLYIKDFVLINELSLDFEEGFSVFTGQTGAGKSILIDAISLLCAERASSSYVAKGKGKTIIEGTFQLNENSRGRKVLEEAGFDIGDQTIFTREIYATGKSTARIDHRTVTLSLIKECLKGEIDIHGQRENEYLLSTANHLHLLDEYLKDDNDLKATEEAYSIYDHLLKERDIALSDIYNENDLEYFRYELNEIEAADLKPDEYTILAEKERHYRSIKQSQEKLNALFALYNGNLADSLYDLHKQVLALSDGDELDEIKSSVSDAYYSLTDAIESLRASYEQIEFTEDDINQTEERLYTIQKLKHKYGRTINDILAKKEELKEKIKTIEHRREYLDDIDQKINDAFANYMNKAEILSAIRKEGSSRLDEAIAGQLKDLMLENARFKTSIDETAPSSSGIDKVEFLVAMNKGETFKPLVKTASGGELSRLMLGLKIIFTRLQKISTVIFDEIDAGVSGAVASAIGLKMKVLSSSCQVFAVTHLAQVASCGEHHYLVEKSDDDVATYAHVKKLNDNERIDEIALIAYGKITSNSLKAAGELLKRSK